MDGLAIKFIESFEELEHIRDAWWRLWKRDTAASPFQSPAWLVPWLREFANDGFLIATAFSRGNSNGELLGFLPLTTDGAGWSSAELCGGGVSDYLDGLFLPARATEIAERLMAALPDYLPDLQSLSFSGLRSASVLRRARMSDAWKNGGSTEAIDACPVLDLSQGDTEMAKILPKRMVKNLKYYRRFAERHHRLEYRQATGETIDVLFDDLLRLHELRWSQRGQEGVLNGDAVRRFHRAAMPLLADAGILRLHVLYFSGAPAAALYGLAAHRRWHYYIGGFDPVFAKFSAGSLIIGDAVSAAIEEGFTAFDFLRGRERYKYLWGGSDELLFRRTMRRSIDR